MDIDSPTYTFTLLAVLLVGALGLYMSASIFTSDYEAKEGQIIKGYYTYGFENHGFIPCNREEYWWVSHDRNALEIYEPLAAEENQLIYMELKANLSDYGRFGHMGMSNREIEVVKVISAKTEKESGCEAVGWFAP